MTLEEFLEKYDGDESISIEGYCDQEYYDYYTEVDEELLSDDNPNHYKPTSITNEPWWNEVKDREIRDSSIIGGSSMFRGELWIDLKK